MDTSETGIRIEFSGGRPNQYTLAEANVALAPIGSRIWHLDLSNVPSNLANLLSRSTLTDKENQLLKSYFLLPRERLLEIITEAGRQPSIPGGGAVSTKDETNGVQYPQLYVADPTIDYSRFDRLHINRSDNGIPVDEIGQLISGRGFLFCHRLDSGEIVKIHLNCPNEKTGWLTTHSGEFPHIVNFTAESVGAKAVVQVIGPEFWKMHYVDEMRET